MRRPALLLRTPLVGLLALGLVVGAAACSSSSDSKTSSSSSTPAPEDILVSNAEVTAGLAKLNGLMTQAASQVATSASAAKATADQAAQQWEAIEGRIKKNDTDAYLKFEDSLSDLRTGAQDSDAAKVAKATASIAAISAAYLAKFPG